MCIEFKGKSQVNIVQIISITRLGEYQTILTNWTRNKIRNWNPPLLKDWFRLQSVRFICPLFHEEKKKENELSSTPGVQTLVNFEGDRAEENKG